MRSGTILYFAYGSNMSSRRLRTPDRAPAAVAIGAAFLPGHRLVFDKLSLDGSGKADCERNGDFADRVCGGLFEIAESDLAALDKAEGVMHASPGYRREQVMVTTDTGPVRAVTYLANIKRPGLLPYAWYVRHVLEGAKEFDLPADYVAALARQPTQADQDRGREVRELSIYG